MPVQAVRPTSLEERQCHFENFELRLAERGLPMTKEHPTWGEQVLQAQMRKVRLTWREYHCMMQHSWPACDPPKPSSTP